MFGPVAPLSRMPSRPLSIAMLFDYDEVVGGDVAVVRAVALADHDAALRVAEDQVVRDVERVAVVPALDAEARVAVGDVVGHHPCGWLT